MKSLWMLLAAGFLIGTGEVKSQTVGKKPPKLTLTEYNPNKDDGMLQFEVDVRMADCISYLEFKNDANKKAVQVPVSEKDYVLSEENGEDILLRIPVGTLKEFLKKKEKLPTELIIYSKTGKPIYTNEVSVNKFDLINAAPNTWR